MNETLQTALIIIAVLAVIYYIVEKKRKKKKKSSGGSAASLSTYSKASLSYPGGFLWKPVSDGFQGRLVVLTQAGPTESGSNISILNNRGKLVERGRWHNAVNAEHPTGANGGRMHWIFNRTGSGYGTSLVMSINGKHYKIPNGGTRYGN